MLFVLGNYFRAVSCLYSVTAATEIKLVQSQCETIVVCMAAIAAPLRMADTTSPELGKGHSNTFILCFVFALCVTCMLFCGKLQRF